MMKVKNLFSNRRTKKKKSQATSSTPDTSTVDRSDKLIIPTAEIVSSNAVAKENDLPIKEVEPCPALQPAQVVLRHKPKKKLENSESVGFDDPTKPRASSASSTGSGKGRSRRPWSFIDQIRRQDSRESAYSTGSSIRTSQVVEELMSSTPPPRYDDAVLAPEDSMIDRPRANTVALTLPRSLTPEIFPGNSNAVTKHLQSSKRRTIDFRFFNFFKRSGDATYPESSGTSSLGNNGRSSFRNKTRGKKKQGSKKKKDLEESKSHDSTMLDDSVPSCSNDTPQLPLTMKLDEDTLQNPPAGLYDSDNGLNAVVECLEPAIEVTDKRVPVNGESAAEFATSIHERLSCPSLANANCKASMKHQRRSDPTSGHTTLRIQFSEGNVTASSMTRSASDSADVPSRRSSTACEPRELPLPEDSIASFDSSAYIGQRYRMLHSGGSVPHLAMKVTANRIQRTQSNDVPKDLSAEKRMCSQSVTNLPSAVPNSSTLYLSDNNLSGVKRTAKPSPIQQKQIEQSQATAYGRTPSSPVLRAIGYPGVVLRRDRESLGRRRPTSGQRAKLVMSLNVEDLPTYYSESRFDRAHVSAFPSCENILRESRSSSKRHSGLHFSGTAGSRARRRGATTHGLHSARLTNAVSVEDLDSLSSSNFGSKQSLLQLDDDENLNAMLARRQAVTHTTSSNNLRIQEPSLKKAKAIRKSVASLANLISPGKPNQKSKLQRSSSFKESGLSTPASNSTAAAHSFKPYKPPSYTPNKKNNRRSKLWCETFEHSGLSEGEIRRQEAIYELYQGERDLVQDLTMAKQTYRDSMVTLKMLSDEEVALIFGKLGCLLPLHEELLAKLEQARTEDGKTSAIGYIFVEWFPRISTAYQEYCANQSDAKYALDAAVERDARVRDFLQRCLESPFSRKLDLWSYLDLPRTRLVKYPLLLQNITKRTPHDLGVEKDHLSKVMDIISNIIEKVDGTTGEQQCRYVRSKLEYLDEKQKSAFVENSRLMLCSGQLKNNRGTKMHVFLFEAALVLTRQTTRSNKVSYQVYRHPLPLRSLVVDVNEGEKLSGSFRGGILSSDKVKHSFRVRCEELNAVYTLQASDEHDKKQWVNAIQEALTKYRAKFPDMVMDNVDFHSISKRRATYDPSSKKNGKSRQVNRSSSDKSNTSVTSSSDKSSTLDESQDDVSTTSEDTTTWGRTRSQTVNVMNVKAKTPASVSRNSSGSSTRSDESSSSSSSGTDKTEVKLKERLRRLETDGNTPKSLRTSLRKKSLTRHFSLGKGDKNKVVFPHKTDDEGRERQKCQRSRSLNSPPQTIKSISSRNLSKKLGNENLSICVTAAKPPIAPSSPFSDRRFANCRPPEILQQARSTPDLTKIVHNVNLNSVAAMDVPLNSSNDSSDTKDGLQRNNIETDTEEFVIQTSDDKDAAASPSELLPIHASNHDESPVVQISVSDAEESLTPSHESRDFDNLDIGNSLSDADDLAGPCSSSDEESLDTLIAISDSGVDVTESVDGEEGAGVHDQTLNNNNEDDRNAGDTSRVVTNEPDAGDSLEGSPGVDNEPVAPALNDNEQYYCKNITDGHDDSVANTECECNHLSRDDEAVAPVANDCEQGYCKKITDGHDAVTNAECELDQVPPSVCEVDCGTNSQDDESVQGTALEADQDGKQCCRSELFDDNLNTLNNNVETTT